MNNNIKNTLEGMAVEGQLFSAFRYNPGTCNRGLWIPADEMNEIFGESLVDKIDYKVKKGETIFTLESYVIQFNMYGNTDEVYATNGMHKVHLNVSRSDGGFAEIKYGFSGYDNRTFAVQEGDVISALSLMESYDFVECADTSIATFLILASNQYL